MVNISLKSYTSYHSLKVPYGGEYRLIMSDGTKVYLNSGTKIRYPNYFSENQRIVELEGEAYFEVAKDKKPFIVQTKSIDVKVLGTSFNVKAYKEEKNVNTTLVEGKVEINTKHNNQTYTLVPGYNLYYDLATHKISQEKVNINLYTSWIRGQFVFQNQSLEEITKQLARWYDVDISFSGEKLKKLKFTGSAYKNNRLDRILNQIGEITNIKFEQDGKNITIYD